MEEKTLLLSHSKISQKIKRLAIEILENNFSEKRIILAGINNNGYEFAKLLIKALQKITDIEIILARIRLNPANPIQGEVTIDVEEALIKKSVIIIVDDVANTGRTIFFAFKPILNVLAKKVEVAVLVDRMHKSFPIKVDYCGLSLTTTVKDNIDVDLHDLRSMKVFMT